MIRGETYLLTSVVSLLRDEKNAWNVSFQVFFFFTGWKNWWFEICSHSWLFLSIKKNSESLDPWIKPFPSPASFLPWHFLWVSTLLFFLWFHYRLPPSLPNLTSNSLPLFYASAPLMGGERSHHPSFTMYGTNVFTLLTTMQISSTEPPAGGSQTL